MITATFTNNITFIHFILRQTTNWVVLVSIMVV